MPNSIFRSQGIGGINTWRDAVEFMLLGAGNVQVCTAVMHYGYRIVEDMIDGLNNYLDDKGFASVGRHHRQIGASDDRLGQSRSQLRRQGPRQRRKCIRCNLCYVACEDGAHQSFEFVESNGKRIRDRHRKRMRRLQSLLLSSARRPEPSKWSASMPAARPKVGVKERREIKLSKIRPRSGSQIIARGEASGKRKHKSRGETATESTDAVKSHRLIFSPRFLDKGTNASDMRLNGKRAFIPIWRA